MPSTSTADLLEPTRRSARPERAAIRSLLTPWQSLIGALVLALGVGGLLPARAHAQSLVSASADTEIDFAGAADHDVLIDDQVGGVTLEDLGTLPDEAEVVAFGLAANGDRLVGFETWTDLGSGVVARPGDVARYDGSSWSIEFDATANGIAHGVRVDALSLAPGGLLFSFDTAVDLAGAVHADDEDLVRWDGGSFSLAFDGSAAGLVDGLDVDAGQDLGGGAFLVSLDTSGSISGVSFDDEDVMRFDGATWTLEYDASAADAAWAATDLDAVLVPEPGLSPGLPMAVAALATAARSARRRR